MANWSSLGLYIFREDVNKRKYNFILYKIGKSTYYGGIFLPSLEFNNIIGKIISFKFKPDPVLFIGISTFNIKYTAHMYNDKSCPINFLHVLQLTLARHAYID